VHWLRRHRLLILTVICVFWTGLFLLGRFVPLPFVSTPWQLEQGFEDVLRKEGRKNGSDAEAAVAVGKLIATRALAAGVKSVVFDRGGYRFHGRVKALADAAREGGLEF